MNVLDYYKAPPEKVFNEIKDAAIKIWRTYDDTFGYASGKVGRIKDLKNIEDNAWYIVCMFDIHNQASLLREVSPETATMIKAVRGY